MALGGRFFFEPIYSECTHTGGTVLLNARAQTGDRKDCIGNTGSGDNSTYKPAKADSAKSSRTGDSSSLIGWLPCSSAAAF